MLAEKRDNRLVQVVMKGRPIEPRRLPTNLGHARCQRFATGSEEREMIGSLDRMSLRRRGQVRFDDVAVPPVGRSPVVFSLP